MKILTDFHLINELSRAFYDFDFSFTSTVNNGGQYIYRISSDIRRTFFSFQNNPKDLDLSYKTDLDL